MEIARTHSGHKRAIYLLSGHSPITDRTFNVTVQRKRPGEHPHYGQGSNYGYAINGRQGASIKLYWKDTYTFRFDDIEGHPFLLSRYPKGGSSKEQQHHHHHPLLESTRFPPMDHGEMIIRPYEDFKLTRQEWTHLKQGTAIYMYYYVCHLHPWMGGVLYLMGDALALDDKHTISSLTSTEHEKLRDMIETVSPLSTTPQTTSSIGTLTPWRQMVETMPLRYPTFMVQSPHADGRFAYVGSQAGQIYEVDLFTTLRGDAGFLPDEDPINHAGMWAEYRLFLNVSKLLTSLHSPLGEQGLLGMAFMPPELMEDMGPESTIPFFIYVSTQDEIHGTHRGRLIRMEAIYHNEDEPNLDVKPGFEEILGVYEPYSNHNGGNLIFGPRDNMLYIGLGDGGSQGDPGFRVQNLTSLHGKILRIDVSSLATGPSSVQVPPVPYEIPKDNPFSQRKRRGGIMSTIYPAYARQKILTRYTDDRNIQSHYETVASHELLEKLVREGKETDATGLLSPLPEIYLWGVRNPWGISFSPCPHSPALIVADVGENKMEEINVVPLSTTSRNLGWPWFEGPYSTESHIKPSQHLARRLLFPWAYYAHTVRSIDRNGFLSGLTGSAVIGGFVYMGSRSPKLHGAYIFGDITGWIAAIRPSMCPKKWEGDPILIARGRLPKGHTLRCFAQFPYAKDDPSIYGEVFALSSYHDDASGRGAIWQIQWDE